MGIIQKIKNGLMKTRQKLSEAFSSIFPKKEITNEFFEDLEYVLISADIGMECTEIIIERLKDEIKKNKLKKIEEVKESLHSIILSMLDFEEEDEEQYPKLIMLAGVNGAGKTTSIGKLAHNYLAKKKTVLMVAGDTFRAGASEQLAIWAERNNCKIIKNKEGSDAGSVVFDGIKSAKSKNIDVTLVDTAGRLQNKSNLMEELKKVNRIVEREWEGKIDKYIVIDASMGQNAIQQVKLFNEAIDLNGVILTKLDGTSKGGIILNIVNEFKLPIKFVGVGEGIEDLMPFDKEEYANSLI